jgi:hypothetical protein
MRNRLLLALVITAGVILVAPVAALLFFMPVRSAGPTPSPDPTVVTDLTAIERVRVALADDLGISPSQLEVVDRTSHDWTDSCLGLGRLDESCLLVIVPGYRVTFRVTGTGDHYIARMNLDGSVYRVEGEGQHLDPAAEEITEMIRFAMMQRLNDESVRVLSYEPETWSNGCLGLPSPFACTEALVPGYRVVIGAADGEYVLRTNLEGSFHRIESSPVRFPAAPDFASSGMNEVGTCLQLALFANGSGVVAACGEAPTAFEVFDQATLDHLARLLEWGPVEEAGDDFEQLVIRGTGDHQPSEQELRAVGEWADLVAQAAFVGRRGASWGLAMSWQDNAEAGCAHVHLERYGVAYASRCTPETNLADVVLDGEQLGVLYGWLDRYASFEDYDRGEDSFFVFAGYGTEQPSEATRDEIIAWIEALHPDR